MTTTSQRPTGVEKNQRDVQYNCTKCFFQGTNKEELSKHIEIKHMVEGSIKCRTCGEHFNTKSNLMNHRKDKHLNTVAHCRNNLKGTCSYPSRMCWWNHADPNIGMDVDGDAIECFICSKTFQCKGSMMIHRKKDHKTVVRKCNLFEEMWFQRRGMLVQPC